MTTTWTNIPKATAGGDSLRTVVQGSPIGLLLALTYANTSSVFTRGWTNIPKATTPTTWTNIPKAT